MSIKTSLSRLVLGALSSALAGSGCGGDARSPEPAAIVIGPTQAPVATATMEARTAPAMTATSTTPPETVTAQPVEPPTPGRPAAASAPAGTQPPAATAPAPTTAAPPRDSRVGLTVRADALAFDLKTLRVFAGTTVDATMQNVDAGVPHNLAFSLPGLPHGETCTGPCTTTQTFKADSPGSYYFLCTLHDMVGSFIVDP